MSIKTRRRALKRTPPFTQSASGSRPGVRPALVVHIRAVAAMAAHWVLAGVGGAVRGSSGVVVVVVVVVDAVVAVVGGAFGVVAQDLVCGGDAGETGGSGGVFAVAVWVVAEGEGVELSVWYIS